MVREAGAAAENSAATGEPRLKSDALPALMATDAPGARRAVRGDAA
jgi:hypothetical protein